MWDTTTETTHNTCDNTTTEYSDSISTALSRPLLMLHVCMPLIFILTPKLIVLSASPKRGGWR